MTLPTTPGAMFKASRNGIDTPVTVTVSRRSFPAKPWLREVVYVIGTEEFTTKGAERIGLTLVDDTPGCPSADYVFPDGLVISGVYIDALAADLPELHWRGPTGTSTGLVRKERARVARVVLEAMRGDW